MEVLQGGEPDVDGGIEYGGCGDHRVCGWTVGTWPTCRGRGPG